jgi:hypothetical protein
MAYSVYEAGPRLASHNPHRSNPLQAHDPVLGKDKWSSQDAMLMNSQPKAFADAVYARLMANIDSL